MDDFIASTRDAEGAYVVTSEAKEILEATSMNLCKWTTNSPELRTKWTQGEFAPELSQ